MAENFQHLLDEAGNLWYPVANGCIHLEEEVGAGLRNDLINIKKILESHAAKHTPPVLTTQNLESLGLLEDATHLYESLLHPLPMCIKTALQNTAYFSRIVAATNFNYSHRLDYKNLESDYSKAGNYYWICRKISVYIILVVEFLRLDLKDKEIRCYPHDFCETVYDEDYSRSKVMMFEFDGFLRTIERIITSCTDYGALSKIIKKYIENNWKRQPIWVYPRSRFNALKCNKAEHKIDRKYLKGFPIPVMHCVVCKKYFLASQLLIQLLGREYNKTMFVLAPLQSSSYENKSDSWGELNMVSELVSWGYNVNAKTPISESQGILQFLLDNGHMDNFEIQRDIQNAMKLHANKESMVNAMARWEEDLIFVNEYPKGLK